MNPRSVQSGFTITELVVAIAVIGIIAAMGAIFVKPAIDAYASQQRRAELTDVADTSLRRVARDIRLALPNSVRSTTTGSIYLEFLLTRAGGRYRAQQDDGTVAGEDVLDFTAADGAFDMLGRLADLGVTVASGSDRVVVHNLGIAGADAYNGDTTALINGVADASGLGGAAGEERISFSVPKQFPLESPGRRFQIISGPVTYECRTPGTAAGEGTGFLLRHDGYAITTVWPPAAPPTAGPAVLASYVSGCSLGYTTLALQSRGVVSVALQLTRGGETATLYREIHVNNVP